MGRLSDQINSLEKALHTLEEIIKMPYNKVVRDASIQRFEYSFEIFWKTTKYIYMSIMESFVIHPRCVLRNYLHWDCAVKHRP